jgi:hypothetical protein
VDHSRHSIPRATRGLEHRPSASSHLISKDALRKRLYRWQFSFSQYGCLWLSMMVSLPWSASKTVFLMHGDQPA